MTTRNSAHLDLGRRGEALAAQYLRDRGMRVVARNWRCPDGELDLVLCSRNLLIVCEVKTRTSTRYGTPAESVTDEKAARIRRLARRWQLSHGEHLRRVRFDIVSILWQPGQVPVIRHHPGVF
ncbi:YraN family protein [Actinophytocola sp.]|uniref:YraN family protein n=1 Tax=Actinophytocola sp. TaxID=1872138 RepID=UPI002D7F5CBD|nr:YraN family protein [Actinophytocola sp.]HET9140985.1 YraN family protein [Actinophytocola sp.]